MRKFKLIMLPISLIVLISGCSLFVKEVDYQPIANDLSEINMDKILNAVDGYAEITHSAFVVTSTAGGKNEIKREKDKFSFRGIYNTSDNTALGAGEITFESTVEKNDTEEQISKENSPEFPLNYSENQYINPETNEEFDLVFMVDKLQGIEKVAPKRYKFGLDSPPMISYDLSEHEFNEIINDDLKIDYDVFNKATISLELQEKNKRFSITRISLNVAWSELKNNVLIDYQLNNRISFPKENVDAKREYKQLKNRRLEGN
jgi:phage tail tube protein FII